MDFLNRVMQEREARARLKREKEEVSGATLAVLCGENLDCVCLSAKLERERR
jgi:hypothetical protein